MLKETLDSIKITEKGGILMKKFYESPSLEVAKFEFEDIMTESTVPGTTKKSLANFATMEKEEQNDIIASLQSGTYTVKTYDGDDW